MNRATDADAARFGFAAGRDAGWRDAVSAMTVAMVERGQPVAAIANLLRDIRTVR